MCGLCTEHRLPFNQTSKLLYNGKSGPGNTQRLCDTRPFTLLTELLSRQTLGVAVSEQTTAISLAGISSCRHLMPVDLNLERMTITAPGHSTTTVRLSCLVIRCRAGLRMVGLVVEACRSGVAYSRAAAAAGS